MEPVPVVDEGPGNSSYLLDLGHGRAAVIDPERDPRPYLARADARGADCGLRDRDARARRLRDRHPELAAQGAQVVAAAAAGLGFDHRGLRDRERLDLGGLVLEAVTTPGHTPEHLAWLLRDRDRPVGVFTGGALVVGGMARTDLTGADQAEKTDRRG